jgi:hypothetical protein
MPKAKGRIPKLAISIQTKIIDSLIGDLTGKKCAILFLKETKKI